MGYSPWDHKESDVSEHTHVRKAVLALVWLTAAADTPGLRKSASDASTCAASTAAVQVFVPFLPWKMRVRIVLLVTGFQIFSVSNKIKIAVYQNQGSKKQNHTKKRKVLEAKGKNNELA